MPSDIGGPFRDPQAHKQPSGNLEGVASWSVCVGGVTVAPLQEDWGL